MMDNITIFMFGFSAGGFMVIILTILTDKILKKDAET